MTTAGGSGTGPVDEAMAAFRDRARVSNLRRLEVVAEALERLRAGVLPEDLRLTARRAAHSLVGSAGTFGLEEASSLGRGLEALFDEVDGPVDSVVRAQRGLELVDRVRDALGGAAEPRPPTA